MKQKNQVDRISNKIRERKVVRCLRNNLMSLSLVVVGILINVGINQAVGQEYPRREVRIVIGFPAGAGADLIGSPLCGKTSTIGGSPSNGRE